MHLNTEADIDGRMGSIVFMIHHQLLLKMYYKLQGLTDGNSFIINRRGDSGRQDIYFYHYSNGDCRVTDIIKSILAINPNAEVSINADDVKQITWHNGTTPIAEADILANKKNYKLHMITTNIKEIEH